MRPFRYLRDGLFLTCVALYVLNRWLIKPLVAPGFFTWWFNDLLLVPCAVPVLLWLERRSGLRRHDDPPTGTEILTVLVLWSVLFEVVAPQLFAHTTGDGRDLLAYAAGAFSGWWWWNRRGAGLPARGADA